MLNGEVYSDADWTDNQQPNGKQTYFTIDGQQMIYGKPANITAIR